MARARPPNVVDGVPRPMAPPGAVAMLAYYTAPFAFARDGTPVRVAASVMDAQLADSTPLGLLRLADVVRQPGRVAGRQAMALSPAVVAALDASDPAGAACLCMASLDRDGYVREAATRLLPACANGYARRFLWMRLDDAVPSIAALADAALARALPALDPGALVAELPLLDQLAARERARGSASLAAALRTLSGAAPAVRDALRRGLSSDDADVRGACARRLADDAGDAARAEALRAGLADPSPAAYHWASREAVSRRTAPAVAAALMPAMCAHANPAVRLRGVRAAARMPDADALLLRATVDADAAVRFEARAALVRGGAGADYRSLAADVLREGVARGGAALGALGAMYDVGARDDWPVVARYLDHPRARVRAEALRALASLAPELFVDVFVARVRDSNRRVAREAASAIERCAASMTVAGLRALLPDEALAGLSRDERLREPCRAALRRVLRAREAAAGR